MENLRHNACENDVINSSGHILGSEKKYVAVGLRNVGAIISDHIKYLQYFSFESMTYECQVGDI